jgi:hypothetical protein
MPDGVCCKIRYDLVRSRPGLSEPETGHNAKTKAQPSFWTGARTTITTKASRLVRGRRSLGRQRFRHGPILRTRWDCGTPYHHRGASTKRKLS